MTYVQADVFSTTFAKTVLEAGVFPRSPSSRSSRSSNKSKISHIKNNNSTSHYDNDNDNENENGLDECDSDECDLEDGKYDMLISNPPYIPPSQIPYLDPNVREWEDHGALCGRIPEMYAGINEEGYGGDGGDGMGYYRRLRELSEDLIRGWPSSPSIPSTPSPSSVNSHSTSNNNESEDINGGENWTIKKMPFVSTDDFLFSPPSPSLNNNEDVDSVALPKIVLETGADGQAVKVVRLFSSNRTGTRDGTGNGRLKTTIYRDFGGVERSLFIH